MKKYFTVILFCLLLFPGVTHAQESIKDTSPDLNLLVAASKGDIKAVRKAIVEDADIDARSYNGITPLMYAAEGGYLKIVELLVEAGADIDASPPRSNRTAFVAAIESGYVEVAEYLFRNSADVSVKDRKGRTILHKAALSGVWEMSDMLLYYNFPVNLRDNDLRTPLMLASYEGFLSTVKVFIKNDADVNLRDTNDNTALHMAAQNGHNKVAEKLLEAGAKTEIVNSTGYTPLEMAALYGRFKTSKILINKGAKIRDSVNSRYNLLNLAKESNNNELVNYLENKGAKINYEPVFNGISFGSYIIANGDNSFISAMAGVHETKYDFNIDMIIGTRTSELKVPVYPENNVEYRIPESRKLAGVGITKRFRLHTSLSGWNYGINTSFFQVFSWAEYTGYRPNPPGEFTPAFSGHLFAKSGFFEVTSGYQFFNLPINNYNPHHFFLSMKFYLTVNDELNYKIKL